MPEIMTASGKKVVIDKDTAFFATDTIMKGILLSLYSGPKEVADIAFKLGAKYDSVYYRVRRLTNDGYISPIGKVYALTEKGRAVVVVLQMIEKEGE